jgi:hypothetical protein
MFHNILSIIVSVYSHSFNVVFIPMHQVHLADFPGAISWWQGGRRESYRQFLSPGKRWKILIYVDVITYII